MAGFNFGAGNAAKLLRAPLMVLGRLATAVIPRSRDRWVFGSAFGVADGALALYRRAAADRTPITWLASTDAELAEATSQHIPAVRKESLRGFWRTARARVVVVTHGFGDVNRYATSGALIVQLWHGIPLKRIGLDSPQTAALPPALAHLPGAALLRRALTAAYRWSSRRIDVIPAASPLARGRLESAFALRETAAVVTGEPRVDVLSSGTLPDRRAVARALIEGVTGPLDPGARLVLYAPTWRDGAADPGIPTAAEWAAIDAALERSAAMLLIRAHPLGAGRYSPPTTLDRARIRPLPAADLPDVLPALAACEALITDYSSLIFEAGMVGVPVVFLAPDLADYAATRGLYGRYSEVADQPVTDWTAAAARLHAILTDATVRAEAVAHAEHLARTTHTFADGDNTERLYRVIRRRIYDASRTVGPAATPNLIRYLDDGLRSGEVTP